MLIKELLENINQDHNQDNIEITELDHRQILKLNDIISHPKLMDPVNNPQGKGKVLGKIGSKVFIQPFFKGKEPNNQLYPMSRQELLSRNIPTFDEGQLKRLFTTAPSSQLSRKHFGLR
jgi:hypothetical protein